MPVNVYSGCHARFWKKLQSECALFVRFHPKHLERPFTATEGHQRWVHWLDLQAHHTTLHFSLQSVFGWERKKNRNALSPNAEGRRRRGSSAQGARSFNAARGSGRAPWAVPAGLGGARPPNDIWCIFGLKLLYLARPSLAKTYAWWSFTTNRVILKGAERRSGPIRTLSQWFEIRVSELQCEFRVSQLP